MASKRSKKRRQTPASATLEVVSEAPALQSTPAAAPDILGSSWLKWVIFNATVAVAAACIMGVEILSTRLVARYLGASLYTWTSAIGVVLAGIAIGNYIGGRLADRYRPRPTLSLLFIGASLLVTLIPIVSNGLGEWSGLDYFSWPKHIFLHFLLVFLLPASLLGTMSPVVAKMALDVGLGPGRTIGTIYAWSSIGSIVGTFVAGFFLVAWVGTESAIFLIAGVLALMGLAYGFTWISSTWSAVFATLLIGIYLPWSGSDSFASMAGLKDSDEWMSVFLEDSQYQRVKVLDVGFNKRLMQLDKLTHSKVNLSDPLDLDYQYEAIYAEITRIAAPPGSSPRSLFIGGGGYVFPRYMELSYPGSEIDVIEIDPVVTEAAFEAMNLPRDTTIRSFNSDARNTVTDMIQRKRRGIEQAPYDLIYGDAFSDVSVPFQLTTVEFNRLLHELLSDNGTYIMNLIDTLASGQFLGSVIATCREVFPHVDVFAPSTLPQVQNTFVVICSKRDLDLSGVPEAVHARTGYEAHRLTPHDMDKLRNPEGQRIVLTDDYAPVEQLLAPVVMRYTRSEHTEDNHVARVAAMFRKGELDEVFAYGTKLLSDQPGVWRAHFWRGLALLRKNMPDEAIGEFEAELARNPTHMRTHASLGLALEDLRRYDDAVRAYAEALELEPDHVSTGTYLARVLYKAGREEESIRLYRQIVEKHPGFARARVELGRLLYARREMAASVTQLQRAYTLDADYPRLRRDLAMALMEAGRPGDAVPHLRALLDAQPESADLHFHVGRALAREGRLEDAISHLQRGVALDPGKAAYHANLGLALEEQGELVKARTEYQKSLQLNPDDPPLINALARLLATSTVAEVRDGANAVRWAERLMDLGGANSPQALDTLSAAYAEAGRFREATTVARRAVDVADRRGQRDLAMAIRERMTLYEAGHTFRVEGRWLIN
jgi:tetratricopeptide (TPR) repeat protein/spermidine synthase